MSVFQPPPTWALPILVDETTGKAIFSPIWLKWFIDLTKALGSAGAGTVTSVDVSGGATGYVFTGGPITNAGNLTMSGAPVLAASNILEVESFLAPAAAASAGASSSPDFSSANNILADDAFGTPPPVFIPAVVFSSDQNIIANQEFA